MAEQDHTASLSPARIVSPDLASVAALLAAFSSAGPFEGSSKEAEPERLATLEDFARQDFEPWPPNGAGKLSNLTEFLARCREDHTTIRMALATMERDPDGSAALAAGAPERELRDFMVLLRDAAERYRGLAEMLESAEVRVLCGIARHRVAIGSAEGNPAR